MIDFLFYFIGSMIDGSKKIKPIVKLGLIVLLLLGLGILCKLFMLIK